LNNSSSATRTIRQARSLTIQALAHQANVSAAWLGPIPSPLTSAGRTDTAAPLGTLLAAANILDQTDPLKAGGMTESDFGGIKMSQAHLLASRPTSTRSRAEVASIIRR
jgi:hypothetical protein